MKPIIATTTTALAALTAAGCLMSTPRQVEEGPGAGCHDGESSTVHYVASPAECMLIDFDCSPPQEYFSDECGCGCIGPEPETAPGPGPEPEPEPTPIPSPEPEEGCPDPDDPEVHYIEGSNENPEICWVIDFFCPEGQALFSDECGCGCIGPEPAPHPTEPCPAPEDPEVHYLGDSHEDPSICTVVRFACDPWQAPFSNECGCGCIGPEEEPEPAGPCPDPTDPRVHYVSESPDECLLIDFACSPGQEYFWGECGCGCIDLEPTEPCPDPADPAVHYVEGSDENPEICWVIDFVCSEGQTLFSNECGCGCIDEDPCADLGEAACIEADSCQPCYAGFCDCTCPGAVDGCEGGGCEGCPADCFAFAGCHTSV